MGVFGVGCGVGGVGWVIGLWVVALFARRRTVVWLVLLG